MISQDLLRISTLQDEGVMRTSKWVKCPVLLSSEEMRSLFSDGGDFSMYIVSRVVGLEEAKLSKEDFLEKYSLYATSLQEGRLLDESGLRPFFSAIMTVTKDVLYAMGVGQEKYLVKALRPVVQMQLHHFTHSKVDGSYHSMVQGKESITWGIQFSYPHIYQKPKDGGFEKVGMSEQFPNSGLFQRIVKWLRSHSAPTPFLYQGVRQIVPVRLGKQSFNWIHRHPGLAGAGLEVVPYKGGANES